MPTLSELLIALTTGQPFSTDEKREVALHILHLARRVRAFGTTDENSLGERRTCMPGVRPVNHHLRQHPLQRIGDRSIRRDYLGKHEERDLIGP
jgi:hypothetical protein